MLGETLSKEEPALTAICIRPGVVNTQMQVDLRSQHFPKMLPENVKKFASMHEKGTMLKPEQPGNVMARLVLNAPRTLSGKFIQCANHPPSRVILVLNFRRWDAPEIAEFQDPS